MSGHAEALKANQDGGEDVVFVYDNTNANEYFGELSLLRDEPRAASIKATSTMTVASIDRLAFKRLFGPFEKILERNAEKYAKFMEKK